MKHLSGAGIVALAVMTSLVFAQGEKKSAVSFKSDVFPIIKAKCLPCHAEDNFNPSELSMDSYELIARGGKHGVPFKPGNSAESLIIQKVSEDPPFGDRMPLNSKKKIREGKAVWLTPEEVKTIATWIDQGAKNN
ncbi:MAG TPA: c-type cytochrome domain-containing protein [Bacteroidota bacterium]|nr:c-type cytochrome domain-containing protein [Bacteroidota bacterium]